VAELRFDGRVAIVTGAGGNPSLGRAFAHLLAARGAKVVVNDLGVGPDGRGLERAHADVVAREIVDAGGEAVADTNSVAEEESARAIVQTALDAWGRVDILVNNAGVCVLASFEEVSAADIRRQVEVHLFGNIWMSRAVWPHMIGAGYGRVVNIVSGAMFGGMPRVVAYGAAKGGIFGLTRGLAGEGHAHGIRVNALGPAAGTKAHQHLQLPSDMLTMMMERMPPELVAPVVAFLAHEDCPCSGKYFESGGGQVREHVFAETAGFASPTLSPEEVRDNFDAIIDRESITITPDPSPDTAGVGALLVPKPYVPE
jgi:NAD(P)-dependent dehydrogenase (short-subunit alcohol dehydrogenase family)